MNTFSNKKPCLGSVRSVKRIVGPKATGEICHIVLDHGGQMPFWEGQSLGIIPPGLNDRGKANKVLGLLQHSNRVVSTLTLTMLVALA